MTDMNEVDEWIKKSAINFEKRLVRTDLAFDLNQKLFEKAMGEAFQKGRESVYADPNKAMLEIKELGRKEMAQEAALRLEKEDAYSFRSSADQKAIVKEIRKLSNPDKQTGFGPSPLEKILPVLKQQEEIMKFLKPSKSDKS